MGRSLMALSKDTIFALATPPGKSAIAVIRISGPNAQTVPAVFFTECPAAGAFTVAELRDDEANIIDQVLLLFMANPVSSTGEDVLEIQCHGSRAVTARILDLLARQPDMRPAEPGEFTHRAFHNGKMDLSGAEGLADLIDAETDVQLTQAWNQMDGALRQPVLVWRDALITVSAQLEALIDFSDESLPESVENHLRMETEQLLATLEHHLDDGYFGEIVRDGVTIALVGPVNAGKSTLLNKLAGREAAIVSDEAGTTRDIVSIRLDLGGVPATIMDTAGIRNHAGNIEAEGIRRAKQAAKQAQISIIVLDGSHDGWRDEMTSVLDLVAGDTVILVNKSDLGGAGNVPDGAIIASLSTGDGVDQLIEALIKLVIPANIASRTPLITRARHRVAMENAALALKAALAHDFDSDPELAAEEFRQAATALGRITGAIDVEELLGSIFSSFCIGK